MSALQTSVCSLLLGLNKHPLLAKLCFLSLEHLQQFTVSAHYLRQTWIFIPTSKKPGHITVHMSVCMFVGITVSHNLCHI